MSVSEDLWVEGETDLTKVKNKAKESSKTAKKAKASEAVAVESKPQTAAATETKDQTAAADSKAESQADESAPTGEKSARAEESPSTENVKGKEKLLPDAEVKEAQ